MGLSRTQPLPVAANAAAREVAPFFICGVLSGLLLEPVFLGVVADYRRREDLGDIFERLLRQLLEAVQMPEIALLLAEPARLLRHLVQHPAHARLALVVGSDGQHERVL